MTMDELEEAGKKALEKMSAEHQFVWENSRLKTLSEVEKVIEGMLGQLKNLPVDGMKGIEEYRNGGIDELTTLQSAIQEMKK